MTSSPLPISHIILHGAPRERTNRDRVFLHRQVINPGKRGITNPRNQLNTRPPAGSQLSRVYSGTSQLLSCSVRLNTAAGLEQEHASLRAKEKSIKAGI